MSLTDSLTDSQIAALRIMATHAPRGRALEVMEAAPIRDATEAACAALGLPLMEPLELIAHLQAEILRPKAIPQVVLTFEGSVYHAGVSNMPIDVILLDEDTEGGDPENIVNVGGHDRYARIFSFQSTTGDTDAEVNPGATATQVAEVNAHFLRLQDIEAAAAAGQKHSA